MENSKAPAKKPAAGQPLNSTKIPHWQKHLQDGSRDQSRMTVSVIVTIVVIIVVLASVLVALALRPGPRTVFSELSVTSGDVAVLTSTPSGDNRTAIVPVEVELSNVGLGPSGAINVWVGAYNRSNENQRFSEFNTSDLVRVDNGQVVSTLQPSGQPGSIARARGNLTLPPGDYNLQLRIYEDGGKRTLVSGYIYVNVDQSMVATPQNYVPQGGGRGKGTPEGAAGGIPGFEGAFILAAFGAAAFLLEMKMKR